MFKYREVTRCNGDSEGVRCPFRDHCRRYVKYESRFDRDVFPEAPIQDNGECDSYMFYDTKLRKKK